MITVNYVAVVVAAFASYLIGALWYSPALFGKLWMRERGVSPESAKGGMNAKTYVLGFAAELVTAFVLAHFIAAFEAASGGSAFVGAIWAWLGFQATLLLNAVMYENASWRLYALNAGYRLAGLLAMAAAFAMIG